MATRSRQGLRDRQELQPESSKKPPRKTIRGTLDTNTTTEENEKKTKSTESPKRASTRSKSTEVTPDVEQGQTGTPSTRRATTRTKSSDAVPEKAEAETPAAKRAGTQTKSTEAKAESRAADMDPKMSAAKTKFVLVTPKIEDAETDDDVRRSSRRRIGKSALELLGISPRKPRGVKETLAPKDSSPAEMKDQSKTSESVSINSVGEATKVSPKQRTATKPAQKSLVTVTKPIQILPQAVKVVEVATSPSGGSKIVTITEIPKKSKPAILGRAKDPKPIDETVSSLKSRVIGAGTGGDKLIRKTIALAQVTGSRPSQVTTSLNTEGQHRNVFTILAPPVSDHVVEKRPAAEASQDEPPAKVMKVSETRGIDLLPRTAVKETVIIETITPEAIAAARKREQRETQMVDVRPDDQEEEEGEIAEEYFQEIQPIDPKVGEVELETVEIFDEGEAHVMEINLESEQVPHEHHQNEGIPQEDPEHLETAEEIPERDTKEEPLEDSETQSSIKKLHDSLIEEVEMPVVKSREDIPVKSTVNPSPKTPASKKKRKKIVKAIVITPSGERREIKLDKGVSTVEALEHILAGTTTGTSEDLAQLAADVNKQIEASIHTEEAEDNEKPPELDATLKNPRSDSEKTTIPASKMWKTYTPKPTKPPSKPEKVVIVRNGDEDPGAADGEVMTVVANVDSDDRMAYEALTQLASGNPLDQPITIQSGDSSIVVDENWLNEHGLKVVVADEKDERWHRQMVGIEDPAALSQLVGRMTSLKVRARPEKHLVASEDLQVMINNLQPDDNMANHVKYYMVGSAKLVKCKHCDEAISDKHHFRKHMTSHKNIDFKPWKCPICHYRASVRAQIARHVNIHGELKPYVCKECGKGFNFKQKLLLHLKYHLDIRDKPCPLCKLAFHEHKTLKNHIIKIHKINPVPPGLLSSKKTAESTGVPPKPSKLAVKNVYPIKVETTTNTQETSKETPKRQTAQKVTKITKSTEEDLEMTVEVVEETQAEEEQTITDEALTEAQSEGQQEEVEVATDTPKGKRTSLLYGTRKTFLYTQQYKMGLLPAADRNNVPADLLITQELDLQGQNDGETPSGQNTEIETKQSAPTTSKTTTTDQLEPLLRQYCRIQKYEGQSPHFFCELCKIEPFTSKTGFIHHLEQRHRDIKAWQCPDCEYNCRMRSSLIVHMKLHTGIKDYPCEICGKKFAFKQKLKNHMKHHLNLREYQCKLCDKAFNERNDLTKHVKKVHQSERDCICTTCGKGFKDQVQLRRHMDGHSNTRYLCEHCNKLYRSRVSLAQHMKCHTCMFHCEICDKNFGSYSGFMAHKVMHDESYEGYECELCKKVLHTKGSLTRHLAIAHSNDRPHNCPECPKTFKTKKDLKNHGIVHEEGRKYACEICEFTCKRPESLRVHMRRHSEVKPFQCGVCGKEYTQKHALETHLRHHTGKVEGTCDICGREFFTRYQLETHMKRKHPTGENLAPEATPTNAAEEAAVAGGEKPVTVFMCEECNSVFMTQDSLAVHILAEHMRQSWLANTGDEFAAIPVPPPPTAPQSLLHQPGLGGQMAEETLEESHIDNTVEIMDEQDGVASTSETAGFDNTVETLVSISNPGGSKQRLVSLLHPAMGRPEAKMETATDKLNALYAQPAQSSHDAYVAITDPASNQEIMVAMPHSNFESLLAATEAEVNSDGTFISAAGEDYITVNAEGDLTTETFVTISSDVMGAGDGIVTMSGGRIGREHGDVAVAETIEIPIEMECVTVSEGHQ